MKMLWENRHWSLMNEAWVICSPDSASVNVLVFVLPVSGGKSLTAAARAAYFVDTLDLFEGLGA